MRLLTLLSLLNLMVLAGCKQAEQTTTPDPDNIVERQESSGSRGAQVGSAPSSAESAELSDVTIDGISILGAWHALEVVGDETATRDLQDGTMKMSLLVHPNGRVALAGIDNREGSGRNVRFDGRIDGNQLELEGLDGNATLFMSGRRLILRDPRGRSTVYIRGVDG